MLDCQKLVVKVGNHFTYENFIIFISNMNLIVTYVPDLSLKTPLHFEVTGANRASEIPKQALSHLKSSAGC